MIVLLDRVLEVPIVTVLLAEAVWPQFAMQVFGLQLVPHLQEIEAF